MPTTVTAFRPTFSESEVRSSTPTVRIYPNPPRTICQQRANRQIEPEGVEVSGLGAGLGERVG
jgi:hypothetical protein